jgi:hypothetical protein
MAARIKITEADIAADKERRSKRATAQQVGFKTAYRMAQLGERHYRVLGQDKPTAPDKLLLDMGPSGKHWHSIASLIKVSQ